MNSLLLDDAVRATTRGGEPLPRAEREFFEPRFGVDFGGVRVHVDDAAAQSVRARAYAIGQDIVFGRGEYAPGTAAGRTLLAHELTHVIQQMSPARQATAPQRKTSSSGNGLGGAMHIQRSPAGNRAVPALTPTPVRIARQPKPGDKAADETSEETVLVDKWKGSVVQRILISRARNRVAFVVHEGALLGHVTTDLPAGTYELEALPKQRKWIIKGVGASKQTHELTRFTVDLTAAGADPWTLSYPEKLPLTVYAGSIKEPALGQDMLRTDPLWLYEGWGNTGALGPVKNIDDYDSITPSGGTPPRYNVKYRDGTERDLVYKDLTPKMLAELKPYFDRANTDFTLFMLQTFPIWWGIVGSPPLAPLHLRTNPYTPPRARPQRNPAVAPQTTPGTRTPLVSVPPPPVVAPRVTPIRPSTPARPQAFSGSNALDMRNQYNPLITPQPASPPLTLAPPAPLPTPTLLWPGWRPIVPPLQTTIPFSYGWLHSPFWLLGPKPLQLDLLPLDPARMSRDQREKHKRKQQNGRKDDGWWAEELPQDSTKWKDEEKRNPCLSSPFKTCGDISDPKTPEQARLELKRRYSGETRVQVERPEEIAKFYYNAPGSFSAKVMRQHGLLHETHRIRGKDGPEGVVGTIICGPCCVPETGKIKVECTVK